MVFTQGNGADYDDQLVEESFLGLDKLGGDIDGFKHMTVMPAPPGTGPDYDVLMQSSGHQEQPMRMSFAVDQEVPCSGEPMAVDQPGLIGAECDMADYFDDTAVDFEHGSHWHDEFCFGSWSCVHASKAAALGPGLLKYGHQFVPEQCLSI